jgi:MFS family permease
MERITVVLHRLVSRGGQRSEGFVRLFISKRLIHGLASAMVGLFVPIFLYETSGDAFWVVGLFYAVVSLLYVFFLVPGMKLTNYVGFSRTLAVSMIFAVVHYVILYFTTMNNLLLYLPALIISLVGFRLFHWVPYHVDFTQFTKGGSRGRDVSLMFATVAFMSMLGPILAGYIIETSSYSVLFGVSIVLMTFAGFSYLFVPEVIERFTWTYKQTVQNLFSKDFRPILVGDVANGAETVVNLIAWPIFLFVLLDGNMLEIGGLSALIVGVTILIQVFVGRYIDARQGNSISTLKHGSIFYAAGWIIKIFVVSAAQVFLVGLYHNITRIFIQTPYNSILYDMSGDQGQYVDEFTVMREMANHIGRIAALLVMIGLTFYVSIVWTFIIGAAASLLLNMVYQVRRA